MDRRQVSVWLATAVIGALLGGVAAADSVEVTESHGDLRVMQVRTQVTTRGKLLTADGPGKTRELPIEATAAFQFRERRLPPAGRDALAYRSVREFAIAQMQVTIEGQQTRIELPAASSMVATSGRLDGLESYSLRTLLTRDQVDLLSLPADPLALAAALPVTKVEAGSEWFVPNWAAQLVAGIEAVETANMTGKVIALDGTTAKLQLTGLVQGMQEGAKTTVNVQGDLTYDVAAAHIKTARVTYRIQAGIGAVSPGIDAEVTATLERSVSPDAGRIADAVVAAIPLEAPPQMQQLVFDAPPWNARLRHGRNWYVFHAVLDAPPRVAILRLVEHGSLVCQCNLSPIPDAAPGQHTPVEQFEQDIQTALGKAFRSIQSRQVTPLSEGGALVQVVALGEVEMQGKDKEGQPTSLAIPMEWRYYLVADRSGRQMSFVFAVEQALSPQLGSRDRELIGSLELLPARRP
jgi:hypothetical protein